MKNRRSVLIIILILGIISASADALYGGSVFSPSIHNIVSYLHSFTTYAAPGDPAGNLDQCANGPFENMMPCTGSAWQNGNLNANQAHYIEWDSVPYRMILSNVSTGIVNSLVIEYDIRDGGKNAIDYITSFNRTESTADACSGVSPCVAGTPFPIPAPAGNIPETSFNTLPSSERNFSIWNGAITDVNYLNQWSLTGAHSATRVQIQFTATDPTVVVAWGGHIASLIDWWYGNSANAINGSPYHTRFIELNGKGGNQDRSLSAGAVLPPKGSITIQKSTTPSDSPQSFQFITTGLLPSSANLTNGQTKTWSGILTDRTYTIRERTSTGWVLMNTSCTGGTNSVVTDTEGGISITLAGNEHITCTFANTYFGDVNPQSLAQLRVIKHVVNDNWGTASAGDFIMNITGSASLSSFTGSEDGVVLFLGTGAYSVSELASSGYAMTASSECSGEIMTGKESKVCTITNDDKPGTLHVRKIVINDNGGEKTADNFSFQINGIHIQTFSTGGQNDVTVDAGTYSITEPASPGYMTTYDNCTDVYIPNGWEATCTITNDDIAPKLTVTKVVINDNGGTATVSDFPLSVSGTPVTSSVEHAFNVGNYIVSEVVSPDYTVSISGDCGTDWSISLALGDVKSCTITNDDKPGEIHGMKFEDINGNGVKEPGEPGLPGWTVNLSGPTGGSTTTDSNGNYSFTGLYVGSYTIAESTQTGWAQITPNHPEIQIKLGSIIRDVDFWNFKLGKISWMKWYDTNRDGVKDSNEVIIPGFTITLTNGSGMITTVTDGSGNYLFKDLMPGTYTVGEIQRKAWERSFPVSPETYTFTILSGTDLTNKDFWDYFTSAPTRTQGFWQTHTIFTTSMFNIYFGGNMPIGNATTHKGPVDTIAKIFGAYYSSIPKKTDGTKRAPVDQARMQLLQQLVTAKFNQSSFGCSLETDAIITAGDIAYMGDSASTMLAAAARLDTYNKSSEAMSVTVGSATPKASSGIANTAFWDMP